MKTPRTQLGQHIQAYRRRHGISLTDLAYEVGVHNSYIGKLEAGSAERGPSIALLYRLAAVMEEQPQTLIKLAGKVDVARMESDNVSLRRRVSELECLVLNLGGTP